MDLVSMDKRNILIKKVIKLVSNLDLPGVDLSTAWGEFFTHNDGCVSYEITNYIQLSALRRLFCTPFKGISLCWLGAHPVGTNNRGLCAPRNKMWFLLEGFSEVDGKWYGVARAFYEKDSDFIQIPIDSLPEHILEESLQVFKNFENESKVKSYESRMLERLKYSDTLE